MLSVFILMSKILLSLIFSLTSLSGLVFLSSSPVLAASCSVSFQDAKNQDRTITGNLEPGTSFKVVVQIPFGNGPGFEKYSVKGQDASGGEIFPLQTFQNLQGAGFYKFGPFNTDTTIGRLAPGTYSVFAYENSVANQCGTATFSVVDYPAPGTCSVKPSGFNPDSKVVSENKCSQGYNPTIPTSGQILQNACQCLSDSQLSESKTNLKFSTCKDGSKGVETALGCVKGDLQSFVNLLFNLALGLAGGLAVLFIIIGGFKVAMSQGDIEALQDGRDLITKAITGLVFILLASTILAIIGIDILGLTSVFQRGSGGSVIVK